MINISKLSSKEIELLKKAGWYQDRDMSSQIQYPEDFILPHFVKNILVSLYGLTIVTHSRELSKNDIIPCFYGNLEFFPENALGENKEGIFKYYAELLNQEFYPLGEITNGFFYISISNDKKVYLLGDNIIKLGNDLYEGLNMLLTGIKGNEFNESLSIWE